jgi:outer membrane protein assembly factor BamB
MRKNAFIGRTIAPTGADSAAARGAEKTMWNEFLAALKKLAAIGWQIVRHASINQSWCHARLPRRSAVLRAMSSGGASNRRGQMDRPAGRDCPAPTPECSHLWRATPAASGFSRVDAPAQARGLRQPTCLIRKEHPMKCSGILRTITQFTRDTGLGLAVGMLAVVPAFGADPPPSITGPAVAWKFDTGQEVSAAPIVADGVVYCGSKGGGFFAIDAATGALVWKVQMKFPVTSRAALAGDTVVVECANTLFALDRKTGQERWHFVARPYRPIASMDFTDYHRSSPVIADNIAYFGDDWGNLNGVRVTDGSLVFQYTTPTQRPIRATPAVHNGVVYFGNWEGEAYAVSLVDKKLLWQHSLENRRDYYGAIVSEFVVADGLVYFGAQHDVFAPLDLATGRPAWTFAESNHTYLPATPLIHEGRVIIATTIFTNSVLCLDRGKIAWAFKGEGIFFTKPVLHGSTLIVNSSQFGGPGYLYLLEAGSGKLINQLRIEKASPSAPAVDNDKVYLGAGDGCIYALKLVELPAPDGPQEHQATK